MLPLLSLAAIATCLPAGGALAAPASHDAAEYQKHVTRLASKEFQGRCAGLEGNVKARLYLLDLLQATGLKGAIHGSYLQPFDISLGVRAKEQALRVLGKDGKPLATLKGGVDYTVLGFSADATFEGPAVFAGYAISDKGRKFDNFAAAPRDALKGKVAVVFRHEPVDALGRSRWTGKDGQWSRGSSLSAKAALAARYGAVAVVIVNPPTRAAEGLQSTASTATRRRRGPAAFHATTGAFLQLLSAGGADATDELARLQALADSGATCLEPLGNVKLAGTVKLESVRGTTNNLAVVLPGTGALAGEAVIVGAHWDHIGMGPRGARGGSVGDVYGGANDNASGTAGVALLARRFAKQWAGNQAGNRRTIVFALFGAEERGLIGSRYMAEHLKDLGLEPAKVMAMVNLDMIGRLKDDRLSVWGIDSGPGWRERMTRLAQGSGLKLAMSGPGAGLSDHASFYRAKMPVICFSTGLFPEIHSPKDTADRIDPEGALRIVALAAKLVAELATDPHRIAYQPPRKGGRAYLGARLSPDRVAGGGVLLVQVQADSPAARAGLKDGDVLLRWDGRPLANLIALRDELTRARPGKTVKLTVRRGTKTLEIPLKVGGR